MQYDRLSQQQLSFLLFNLNLIFIISQLTGAVWQALNNAEFLRFTWDVVFDKSITQDGMHMIIAWHLHSQNVHD